MPAPRSFVSAGFLAMHNVGIMQWGEGAVRDAGHGRMCGRSHCLLTDIAINNPVTARSPSKISIRTTFWAAE